MVDFYSILLSVALLLLYYLAVYYFMRFITTKMERYRTHPWVNGQILSGMRKRKVSDDGTIMIQTSAYYENLSYRYLMPQSIFDALESATLNGEDSASVDKIQFDKMIEDYKLKINDHNLA